jgi:hypothetical protein
MSTFTVVSLSADGVRRSLTTEAESEKEAKKVAEAQNDAIADQEQTETYTVDSVTKDK